MTRASDNLSSIAPARPDDAPSVAAEPARAPRKQAGGPSRGEARPRRDAQTPAPSPEKPAPEKPAGAPLPVERPGVAVARGMLLRVAALRRALARGGGVAPRAAPAPWTGPPSDAPLRPQGGPRRGFVFALVAGLEGEALETVLDTAETVAAETEVRLLFVTERFDFRPFRHRRVLFEHWPTVEQLRPALSARAAAAHRTRRMNLLIAKWRPDRIVPYGEAAARALEAYAASPAIAPDAARHLRPDDASAS